MHSSRKKPIAVALAFIATAVIAGCSTSATSPPPAATTALYVGAAGTGPNLAEVFFPFSASSTVTTFAPAAVASVNDVAFDSLGNLFVTNGGSVLVYAHPVSSASLPAATINLPAAASSTYLITDSGNNLWVTDSGNQKVYQFTGPFSGTITPTPAITLSTDLVEPEGLAFDSSGNLYVGDGTSGDIEIFAHPLSDNESPNAMKLTGATNVHDIAFDGSGNLYAGSAGTILRYNAPTSGGGAPNITDASTGIASVAYMCLDTAGNLYVADYATKNVYQFTSVATTFGSSSTPATTLNIASFTGAASGCEVGPK